MIYRFIEDQAGRPVPVFIDAGGNEHILHSRIAPEKEAERIIGTLSGEGYIVILGLGAGYMAKAALNRPEVQKVLVIDYNELGIIELRSVYDYSALFNDDRFVLLVDRDTETITRAIVETYIPCIHSGLRVIPLKPRCDYDEERFLKASAAIKKAAEIVSGDFSVQTHFGKRWFSNIIRNVYTAEPGTGLLPYMRRCAVCAAGPSLDDQIPAIYGQRENIFVLSTDTALGTLFDSGIKPDAVISIDCQHISYLHFMRYKELLRDTPLFLDFASPPLLGRISKKTFFLGSAHPFVRYASENYKSLLPCDSSGGNVTFAAISLAQTLGAKSVSVYGADFSYPDGFTYTRGAYFYPYLMIKENRFSQAFSQTASFIYKIPSLGKKKTDKGFYYETRVLSSYRESLEKLSKKSYTPIRVIPGRGAPVACESRPETINDAARLHADKNAFTGAGEFLSEYKKAVSLLPVPSRDTARYFGSLNYAEKNIFSTLLPLAAAIKKEHRSVPFGELIEITKDYCIASLNVHARR